MQASNFQGKPPETKMNSFLFIQQFFERLWQCCSYSSPKCPHFHIFLLSFLKSPIFYICTSMNIKFFRSQLCFVHLRQKISDVNIFGHLMRPKILTSEKFRHPKFLLSEIFATPENMGRHFLSLNCVFLCLKCVFSCLHAFYI